MNGWISVKDRIPEKPCRVMIYRPGDDFGSFGKGFYAITTFLDKGSFCQGETHWMPLPEPPKEKT